MKTPCDECLVYPTCARTCIPHAHFNNALHNEIKKFSRFIYSKNKHIRKRIPEQKRLHYNHLINTWNRGIKQVDIILLRIHPERYE